MKEADRNSPISSRGDLQYSRHQVLLIVFSLGTAALAAAVELLSSNWNETSLATGPIVPLAAVWYVISNYLCANAVYLYCKDYVARWILVVCWIGLAGGGTDHIIETWTWFNGNHEPFGTFWETASLFGISMHWFPFVAFGFTSVAGIWAATYVLVRYDANASRSTKIVFTIWSVAGAAWALMVEPSMVHSTVVWHTTHTFITHLLLSMIPPIIVWSFAPHMNLFSFLPRVTAGDNDVLTPPING